MKPSADHAARLGLLGWCDLALRLVLGMALGFLLHYALYRLSLPVQPFIYVAF